MNMTQKITSTQKCMPGTFIDGLHHKKCVDEAQPLVRNQDGGGQQ